MLPTDAYVMAKFKTNEQTDKNDRETQGGEEAEPFLMGLPVWSRLLPN